MQSKCNQKIKVEVGLKFEIMFLTQHFYIYFTQIWVQTTQHCLECIMLQNIYFIINLVFLIFLFSKEFWGGNE